MWFVRFTGFGASIVPSNSIHSLPRRGSEGEGAKARGAKEREPRRGCEGEGGVARESVLRWRDERVLMRGSREAWGEHVWGTRTLDRARAWN